VGFSAGEASVDCVGDLFCSLLYQSRPYNVVPLCRRNFTRLWQWVFHEGEGELKPLLVAGYYSVIDVPGHVTVVCSFD
jgi:hypothetical protein